MDDFVILLKSKKECKYLKSYIELFLKNTLHLELNSKSKYYPYNMGVNFCGYRIFTTHRLLRIDSKKKIKRKIKKWNKLYFQNRLEYSLAIQSLNSWLGHSSHCNSYNLQRKMINKCSFIYNDKIYNSIEEDLINLIDNNKM